MVGKKKTENGNVTVRVNKRTWKEVKPILREIGISRSCFINITLGQLLRESQRSSSIDVSDDVVGTLFELSRKTRKRKAS